MLCFGETCLVVVFHSFARFSSARFSDAGVLCSYLRVAHLLRNSVRDHRLGHRGKLFLNNFSKFSTVKTKLQKEQNTEDNRIT